MTNDEKIDRMLKFYHGTKTLKDYLLEMAEWKEQQMIDKAVEWLKNNIHDYYTTNEFEQWFDEMFKDFKQAMMEE